VVEDDAVTVGPGQLKKSDFLARLRGPVEAALAGSGHDGEGRPRVEQWLAPFADRSAESINGEMARFISGASPGPQATAAAVISAVAASSVRCGGAAGAALGQLARRAVPALRSGPRLQRCPLPTAEAPTPE
jgi:hypothetical protein